VLARQLLVPWFELSYTLGSLRCHRIIDVFDMDVNYTDLHTNHISDCTGDRGLNVATYLSDVDIRLKDDINISINNVIHDFNVQSIFLLAVKEHRPKSSGGYLTHSADSGNIKGGQPGNGQYHID
jgi:hypothetical protein